MEYFATAIVCCWHGDQVTKMKNQSYNLIGQTQFTANRCSCVWLKWQQSVPTHNLLIHACMTALLRHKELKLWLRDYFFFFIQSLWKIEISFWNSEQNDAIFLKVIFHFLLVLFSNLAECNELHLNVILEPNNANQKIATIRAQLWRNISSRRVA